MSWVTSFGWQCDGCGTDSGITFGSTETAEREAAVHAGSLPDQDHKITIVALHDEVHEWEEDEGDADWDYYYDAEHEDDSDLAYEGGA